MLSHKGCFVFMEKKFLEIFMSRHSKLCEMSKEVIFKKWVFVCVCILKLGIIQVCVSQELFGRSSWNFVCAYSRCGLTLISFSLQLNRGFGFYKELNFWKNVCNRSAANLKRSSWIVLYKEINVQRRLGLNLWKKYICKIYVKECIKYIFAKIYPTYIWHILDLHLNDAEIYFRGQKLYMSDIYFIFMGADSMKF